MSRTLIHIEGVTKRFGELAAVNDVSLEIAEGEFFALLGPSGCGKTTLLRMLAGLEVADAGRITIDGQDMTGVPPNRRPVNMVFQSYAVFPHMSVADNVAYGLRMDGVARAERDARVSEALGLVKLGGMEARRPDQLSGGQRQRVALARALVKRPRVLLLDEPLSALDAKLREAMRSELAQIQDRVGVTFVMVTHDQDEALAMASRCAVMNHGLIEQIASPSDLYEYPVNRFVADFIGSVNLFEGKLSTREGLNASIACPELAAEVHTNHAVSGAAGDEVWVAIRPEKIAMAAGEAGATSPNTASGRIKLMSYLGSETLYEVELANGRRVKVLRPNFARAGAKDFEIDQPVGLSWTAESVALLTS